jgi:exosome complex component RRP4
MDQFDSTGDGTLNLEEIQQLFKSLFSFNGTPYVMQKAKVEQIFGFFDADNDQKWSLAELDNFWHKIVKQTIIPRSSLVIVDVQNDFITGTLSLKNCPAKHEAVEVVPCINQLMDTVAFNVITYTFDWHPANHCSFIENVNLRAIGKNSRKKENIKCYDSVIFEAYPDIEQKLWPAHCIEDTDGAKLHPDLKVVTEESDAMKRKVVTVKKGTKQDIDSYSAFFDNCKLHETSLNMDLKKHGITDLYVCGLAADVCVAATSMDGLGLNYRVIYVEDACRGVDLKDIDMEKKRLVNQGALVVNSKQVHNMVACKDRRPELAYSTFLQLDSKSKRIQSSSSVRSSNDYH